MLGAAALLAGGIPAHASAFGPGEQTILKVEVAGFRAGTATITVGNATEQAGKKVYPVVLLADTASLFALYPLHDKFVTWWSFEKGRSVGWDFTGDENHHDRRERVRLDLPEPGKAQVQTVRDSQPATSAVVADVPPGAQDIGAALFAVRQLPLTPGAAYTVPIFTGHRSFPMGVHVGAPEVVEVEAGRFTALPVELAVDFGGKLHTDKPIRVWFGNDAHHAILKFEASLGLGSVNGEAVQYQPGLDVPAKSP